MMFFFYLFFQSSRYGGASPSSSTGTDASLSHQLQQLRRDLKESLERESDLRDQLRFTEEEARVMRRKVRHAAAGLISADDIDVDNDDDDDDQRLGVKTSDKTSSRHQANAAFASAEKDKDKEDSELRMQLDSAEHEVVYIKTQAFSQETVVYVDMNIT